MIVNWLSQAGFAGKKVTEKTCNFWYLGILLLLFTWDVGPVYEDDCCNSLNIKLVIACLSSLSYNIVKNSNRTCLKLNIPVIIFE